MSKQQAAPLPQQSRIPERADERDPGELLDSVINATAAKLSKISGAYQERIAREGLSRLEKALITAKGIDLLRGVLDEKTMQPFIALMNSPVGFMTDRMPKPGKEDKTPYGIAEVREVLIAAMLLDFSPYGNEFNIIAGRLYGTKEGYRRKVKEFPGVTNPEVVAGMPMVRDGRTVIRMAARCRLDGKLVEIKDTEGKPGRSFAVKVDQYSSADQTVGKGERKAWKALYELIHGSDIEDVDDTDEVPGEAGSRTEQVAQDLKAKTNGKQAHQPAEEKAKQESHPVPISDSTRVRLVHLVSQKGMDEEWVRERLAEAGAKNLERLTEEHGQSIVRHLEKLPDAAAVAAVVGRQPGDEDDDGLTDDEREFLKR